MSWEREKDSPKEYIPYVISMDRKSIRTCQYLGHKRKKARCEVFNKCEGVSRRLLYCRDESAQEAQSDAKVSL